MNYREKTKDQRAIVLCAIIISEIMASISRKYMLLEYGKANVIIRHENC